MCDLVDIITEVIKDENDKRTNYAFVMINDLKIIIIRKGEYVNYVNLTDLVHKSNEFFGYDKEFNDWTLTKGFKNLIKSLEPECNDLGLQVLFKPEGLSNELKGTYGHPDLLTDLMIWMNPSYARKVGKVMRQYEINKVLDEKDKLLEEQEQLLEEKDEEINKQKKKIKKKNSKIDELNNKVDELLEISRRVDNNVDELKLANKKLMKEIKKISDDRIIRRYNDEDHMLIIVSRNVPFKRQPENYYEYSAIRCMGKALKQTLTSQQKKYPNLKIICTINFTPNAVNLWLNIKDKLIKNEIIECRNTSFNIIEPVYDEEFLIRDITKIHNKRLEGLNSKKKISK